MVKTYERETPVKPPRYGYTAAHRRHEPGQSYPSSLTDAEWALVQDIFENKGRGLPPRFSRRMLVDACCYVVRSGCVWLMLPHHFPSLAERLPNLSGLERAG
jgi:hypothetical protein